MQTHPIQELSARLARFSGIRELLPGQHYVYLLLRQYFVGERGARGGQNVKILAQQAGEQVQEEFFLVNNQ
jgi:hypothetical protein